MKNHAKKRKEKANSMNEIASKREDVLFFKELTVASMRSWFSSVLMTKENRLNS